MNQNEISWCFRKKDKINQLSLLVISRNSVKSNIGVAWYAWQTIQKYALLYLASATDKYLQENFGSWTSISRPDFIQNWCECISEGAYLGCMAVSRSGVPISGVAQAHGELQRKKASISESSSPCTLWSAEKWLFVSHWSGQEGSNSRFFMEINWRAWIFFGTSSQGD